jgi:hypothetical protein
MRLLTSRRYLVAALTLSIMACDLQIAGQQVGIGFFKLISDAEARVGRPATPASVAGVARRTTRRTIRRGAYIATIPAGCAYGSYYGYSLYYCGGTYYQKSGGGYVIVYF